MKLPKRLLSLAYHCVLQEMERSKGRPEKYNEDLCDLELLLADELEKQRSY